MNRTKLVVFLLFFISFSNVIACPVFDGKFDCTESSGRKYKMEIHTRVEDSVSIYEIRTSGGHVTERSDNKNHHTNKAFEKTDIDSKGHCEADHFIYESEWTDPKTKAPKNPRVKSKKTMHLDKGVLVQVNTYSNHSTVQANCNKLP
ncbi:hypothetical protein CIK05_04925 [Bdellovibrio sp. qaytius]|nr:hypothetical protein CIK05_04925 [Bdellovibrio sp. qaytius]